MSHWRSSGRSLGLLLPIALLLLAPVGAAAAAGGDARDAAASKRTYIVMLAVRDAGKAIRPAGRNARQRMRARATQTAAVTDRLADRLGFRTRHRYSSAISGFSARLTPQQAARLRSETRVSSIRKARQVRIAGELVPRSLKRIKAAPSGAPAPDLDVDIALLDTGIGPVGGNELNVRGGINCSDDGAGPAAWQDLYQGRHGTHVAGTAAARDNGIGVVGVAPGARLWSVRVFRSSGFGDETTIVCGLDWAVSTHGPGAPPGTQPIDVINMSLQGRRIADPKEACDGGIDPDPMHEAVCAAYAAGITVVAAAGNDGRDAATIAPAGYDQVITVGALSDFDGVGGGLARSDCRFLKDDRDDSYASYSNYGADVDIVAPGTCVTSTYPTASGTETRRMSGTSMAAPHVSGAVARYLAAHPATSPAQMRKLVRASGRLDWDPTSDPQWFGPNDTDSPKRVLDVKALLGGPSLDTWIIPNAFRVGGTARTRNVRVELQRGGGFDGTVDLSLDGLPGALATSSFDRPGDNLTGLGGLGARLTMVFELAGPDGALSPIVQASAPGSSPDASGRIDILVDRTGPEAVVKPAKFGISRLPLSRTGVAPIRVPWDATDALSRIHNSVLQRRVGALPWKTVARSPRGEISQQVIRPERRYRYRVRSRDALGNIAYTPAREVTMQVLDSASRRWVRTASEWAEPRTASALGGSLLLTRGPGHQLSTTFDGRAMAIVAPQGPRRGVMQVRVDGGRWHKVVLKAPRAAGRRIVFSRRYEPGRHRVEIRSTRGAVAIDALVIIR